MKSKQLSLGFTFVELIVTIAILITLFSIAGMSLVGVTRTTSIASSTDRLLADVREQQLKSQVGDTEGRSTPDTYGMYFDTSSYTMFHGASYNSADPGNFTQSLDTNLQFASPGTSIIFSRVSGEVLDYNPNAHVIVIQDPQSSQQRTITFNRFGVITNVQ
jgi:type II secretory pathway pseudopilin PulG